MRPGSQVIRLQAGSQPRPPLFCMHPFGGRVGVYRHLVEALRYSGPVLGIQSRGLEDLEQEPGTLETAAEIYSNLIREFSPKGPCFLLGWSSGGVFAWAVARTLVQGGCAVPKLVLLDSYLPSDMRDSLPDFEAGLQMVLSTAGPLGELGERMIADLGPHILQLELKAFYEKAGDLPAEERLAEVSRIVRRKLSLFSDLPAVLISRQIDLIVRHDSWLLQFEPSEFRGELILLQPEEGLGYPSDAWRTYARGPIRIEHTPGNHFGMLAPPHVSALAKKLRFHLEMDDLEFCC